MAVNDAAQSIRKDLIYHSKFNSNTQVSANLCIIKTVHPESMTVDIFIPKTSTTFFKIPILLPYLTREAGIIIMPKENAAALYIITSDAKPFVICSINSKYTDQDPWQIMKDENLIFSQSKSFLKQDNIGNQTFMSGGGSGLVLSKYNESKIYSVSRSVKTAASNTLSGVTNIKTDTGVRTLEYSKYYGSINVPITYTKEDIVVVSGNDTIVDSNKRSDILSAANNAMDKVNQIFTDIDSFKKDILTNPYLSEDDIKLKVSQTKTKLYNDYSINRSATLIIEKGAAINKDILSIEDINNLTANDIELSEQNNNIAFRIKVINESTNSNVATLSMDSAGNVKLMCKSYNVVYI
jgi:hypothetical protein